ncbi:MAG: Lrp/AsnC family transcriptional regulator [bacterium]
MDRLLKLLEKNGRARAEDLAANLQCSPQEIEEKLREYEEKGIILGYKAIINPEKAGREDFPVVGLIEVSISPQPDSGFDDIAREIYNHPEVTSCHLCSGAYDLLVQVEAEDLQRVAEFVANVLAPNRNVHKTVSHFMLKTYKEDGFQFDSSGPDHRLTVTP